MQKRRTMEIAEERLKNFYLYKQKLNEWRCGKLFKEAMITTISEIAEISSSRLIRAVRCGALKKRFILIVHVNDDLPRVSTQYLSVRESKIKSFLLRLSSKPIDLIVSTTSSTIFLQSYLT